MVTTKVEKVGRTWRVCVEDPSDFFSQIYTGRTLAEAFAKAEQGEADKLKGLCRACVGTGVSRTFDGAGQLPACERCHGTRSTPDDRTC